MATSTTPQDPARQQVFMLSVTRRPALMPLEGLLGGVERGRVDDRGDSKVDPFAGLAGLSRRARHPTALAP
jgi:hypothetical protein